GNNGADDAAGAPAPNTSSPLRHTNFHQPTHCLLDSQAPTRNVSQRCAWPLSRVLNPRSERQKNGRPKAAHYLCWSMRSLRIARVGSLVCAAVYSALVSLGMAINATIAGSL